MAKALILLGSLNGTSILSGDTVTGQGRTGRGSAGRGARDVPHLNGPKARGGGGDSLGLLSVAVFRRQPRKV